MSHYLHKCSISRRSQKCKWIIIILLEKGHPLTKIFPIRLHPISLSSSSFCFIFLHITSYHIFYFISTYILFSCLSTDYNVKSKNARLILFTALFPIPKTVSGTEWVLNTLLLSQWMKWISAMTETCKGNSNREIRPIQIRNVGCVEEGEGEFSFSLCGTT